MKWIAAAAALVLAGPAWEASRRNIEAPEMLYIGPGGSAGSMRISGLELTGFKGGPNVDIHTAAPGARIRDLILDDQGRAKGASRVAFTLEYDAATPAAFDIEVFVSAGIPTKFDRKSEFEKLTIPVKRL